MWPAGQLKGFVAELEVTTRALHLWPPSCSLGGVLVLSAPVPHWP